MRFLERVRVARFIILGSVFSASGLVFAVNGFGVPMVLCFALAIAVVLFDNGNEARDAFPRYQRRLIHIAFMLSGGVLVETIILLHEGRNYLLWGFVVLAVSGAGALYADKWLHNRTCV